jgi:hypothetical protein
MVMPGTQKNAERRVIKKFYERFKIELDRFVKSIKGISDEDTRRSQAAVLLSRFMFIYLLEAKGFLDRDYLRGRLIESERRGKDRFYRDIICALLFEGFTKKRARRSPVAEKRLGRVPYLNSELFPGGTLERACSIPDEAFRRALDFFDQYRWHLDERPLEHDTEINANVLGSVLERHINQKQMGAYYTKDDITDYACRNTIIPFLFDAASKAARKGERGLWQLLEANPDRYIHSSLKKGPDLSLFGSGVARSSVLPGESMPEAVARRSRYMQLREILASGELRGINELVTHNLDIVRFAKDVIDGCESAAWLGGLWRALEKISVLDPTCGSGAFLFAALRVLEPLYASCLNRMQAFLDESEGARSPGLLDYFREIIRRADEGQNRRYFILKSIVGNNLFGVDLMEEATEICKLRLCLKLLAQIEPGDFAGPLLDIDFNIRTGNALVGFASLNEIEMNDGAALIDRKAQDRFNRVKEGLNNHLARQYRIEPDAKQSYEKWLGSHKPFHWAAEFHRIIAGGGFDVIIGNPPYVNVSDVCRQYTVKDYRTADCPDVYAWALERTARLLGPEGRTGMILPLSLSFSADFDSCRDLLFKSYGENWFASFGRIPAALFNFDVRVRNTIHIGRKTMTKAAQHTTRLYRWFESARPHLFELIEYASFTPELWKNRVPKISARNIARAFERALAETPSTLAASLSANRTPYALHFKKTAYNWLNFCRDLPPCYDAGGRSVPHTKFGSVYFEDAATRDLAFLLLNGKLYFAFWCIIGDDFDVARWMFADFPINLRSIQTNAQDRLLKLVDELEVLMRRNLSFKLNAGRRVGNYNLAKCREVTDRTDSIFTAHLGFETAWPDIELMYEQMVKTDFTGLKIATIERARRL